ncbi:MmcQ/YjbR family DNA-binding protein [Labrys sp. ZIDIC5]|uniref:MmcQ/YjbR family DNA-binding protein n=1 Tax=Labrys sedimenti TaxID=3106036 RepID=UPI002ACA2046|nr:MmcQ/YjbR family DNA-binding protein [Labrys sp. ZIDIC5]MDZ5453170.1 MmcQ/YjbR family DNA-binding protein [Labrys sp. ZIDIC5]
MADADDFRRIALSLDGTSEAPHFERKAFKARRIYATLAPDGLSANLLFTPEEQEFKCLLGPDVFRPIPNAWGRQGWTMLTLSAASQTDLQDALAMAWRHGAAPKKKR